MGMVTWQVHPATYPIQSKLMINQLDLGPAIRWGLGLVVLLAAVFALYLSQVVIVPTVIALLMAAMLWPAVQWLHHSLRFTWTFSCLLMVLSLVALNLLVSVGFGVSITKMLQDIPKPTLTSKFKADRKSTRL